MEMLNEEKFVEKILTKLSSSCGLDHTPVRSFTNPLGLARKNKKLPTEGFIAGGSICNTILSLLDNKDYPINDIDVFIEDNGSKNISTVSTDWGVNRNSDTVTVSSSYNELMTIDTRHNTYSIVDSSRDEMFNYVTIKKVDNDKDKLFILKGFDINCCMVGIDMSTKKLYYTKEFEDFLKHRQLMVINPYTPCHTSLRLIKKKNELGCYLDTDKEMRYLSNVFHMFTNPYHGNMNKVFANFFSEKYKEVYEKYHETISQYFDLVSFVDIKKELYLKGSPGNSIKDLPKVVIETWEKKKLYTFKPKKFVNREYYLDYIPHGCLGPNSLRKLWNIFERSNKTEINKCSLILQNPQSSHFFFSIEGFHKCDFNEKNIEEFVKIFSKSQILIDSIVKSKLNLQESINFYRVIKSICSKESSLFVDIIVERIVESYGFVDKEKLMDKDFLKMIFEEEKTKRSTFLSQPIDLEGFEFKLNTYELVTEYDLMFASRILHNCMSAPQQGYSSKIKSGKTKLFLIETENNYSGVEIDYSTIGYKLRTILGVTNVSPCEKHVYLTKYLINYLNHRHWLLKSNDIMDKLSKNMNKLKQKVNESKDTETINLGMNTMNRIYDDGIDYIDMDNNINVEDIITNLNRDEGLPTAVEYPGRPIVIDITPPNQQPPELPF